MSVCDLSQNCNFQLQGTYIYHFSSRHHAKNRSVGAGVGGGSNSEYSPSKTQVVISACFHSYFCSARSIRGIADMLLQDGNYTTCSK